MKLVTIPHWRIGYWQVYPEGVVHQVLKKCLTCILDSGMSAIAVLGGELKTLTYGKQLFEALLAYEKAHGVSDLLEILTQGIRLECSKQEDSSGILLEVYLRVPSDTDEHVQLFKDMVIAWVESNPLSFTERFFRLPKLTEDPSDRFLDNPLEQTLNKTFGFDFVYRVVITGEGSSPEMQELRKKLYQILR